MKARSTSDSMTQACQPLEGGGLIIRSLIVCPLRGGAANGNDLSVYQGLLNRALESLPPIPMVESEMKDIVERSIP